MPGGSTIRVATAADLDALVHLAAAFRDSLEQPGPSDVAFRSSFQRLLADFDAEFLLACGTADEALGYAQSRYRWSAWSDGLEAELEDVFVEATARRGGIGRWLVLGAIERARARGCRAIGLNTNERNEAALALYSALGFRAERERWSGGRQLRLDLALD
jgi:ribosomal protein S18 acetylase RimI-like enzyme